MTVLALTTLQNSGPRLLEWAAYHLSIGVDHLLIYSAGSNDGGDKIAKRLAQMGHATFRKVPVIGRALKRMGQDDVLLTADWAIILDTNEFLTIHPGQGRVSDLLDAAPSAKAISLVRQSFGSSDISTFHDGFVTETLRRVGNPALDKPDWAMRTLFDVRSVSQVGPYRPKDADFEALNWVHGGGGVMPKAFHKGGWRMNRNTADRKLGQINHYPLISREAFVADHLADPGAARTWYEKDRNDISDLKIQVRIPAMQDRYEELLDDQKLARFHDSSVAWHATHIRDALRSDAGRALMADISPCPAMFFKRRAA